MWICSTVRVIASFTQRREQSANWSRLGKRSESRQPSVEPIARRQVIRENCSEVAAALHEEVCESAD